MHRKARTRRTLRISVDPFVAETLGLLSKDSRTSEDDMGGIGAQPVAIPLINGLCRPPEPLISELLSPLSPSSLGSPRTTPQKCQKR
eukprot:303260-Amphidinium_carterae.1